ncbi:MAG TPA: oligosaccharide flippase family protein [Gaiellaceae bacterium]|nr:oligosaccharide flippase family protein [Gaiellaceae bacterium]
MLARELKRLGTQSAIYGLGGIVSRLIAVFLLPVYTVYLGTVGFGQIETIVALTTVLVIVLRLGITSAFFRFYFDSEDQARRTLVVRTSFWFTMGMATFGLALGWVFAGQISDWLNLDNAWLVRAGFVGLWAQMNYAQMTSLFRVEERPVGFAIASVANVLITIGATIALVVGFHKGPIGAVIGNFLGTLSVYVVLLAYRRYQLGFQFDRRLLRAMNRFGLPLVPSALALWAINLIDRLFINGYKGQAEVGIYSLAVRISSVIVFLMTAFQLAWPAFAYSIRDDSTAKRTYAYVLTYLLFVTCWMSLAIGSMAPWIVHLLAPSGHFHRSAEAVPILCFATAAYSGYSVLAIGIGRMRQTQLNWVVSGTAALVNIVVNIALIPVYGMMGAAVSTLIAYLVLFAGMWLRSRHVYPVDYQWRRILTLSGVAVALTAIAYSLHSLPVAIALTLAYPLFLLPLRFYQPAELTRLRRLAPG